MTFQDLENKLKDLEAKITVIVSSNKFWLVLLIIPVLVLKYRSFIIELLVKDSNKVNQEAVKQDTALQVAQTTADTKANQIILDADQKKKESDAQDVPDDWYKKK